MKNHIETIILGILPSCIISKEKNSSDLFFENIKHKLWRNIFQILQKEAIFHICMKKDRWTIRKQLPKKLW